MWKVNDVPDYLKTQKKCDKVVKVDPSFLQFVPDWFVSKQQLDVWYGDDHDDDIIK